MPLPPSPSMVQVYATTLPAASEVVMCVVSLSGTVSSAEGREGSGAGGGAAGAAPWKDHGLPGATATEDARARLSAAPRWRA